MHRIRATRFAPVLFLALPLSPAESAESSCLHRRCDNPEQAPPASLVNPRKLQTSSQATCVIDDAGLQCWGTNDDLCVATPPVQLAAPTEIIVNGGTILAVDGGRILGWGDDPEGICGPPEADTRATGAGPISRKSAVRSRRTGTSSAGDILFWGEQRSSGFFPASLASSAPSSLRSESASPA
jgi:hypothetical protein